MRQEVNCRSQMDVIECTEELGILSKTVSFGGGSTMV
jgi:hypothetical protein